MSYAGFYINLDRYPDRRSEIEAEFARFGLSERYKRFAAIDGNKLGFPNPHLNAGEMGCFTSHYLLLKENCGQDRHLHILEDDAIFASCTESVLRRIIDDGTMDKFDILYADASIPLSNESYQAFKALYDGVVSRDELGALKSASFQILDLNKHIFSTASSYLVNKNAIEKIYRLYHDELTKGAALPVDAFLRHQADAGILKAGCIFPFITSVRVEHVMDSAVRKVPDVTRRFTAANIARASFFIGCDWNKCLELLDRLVPLPPPDDRLAHILAHVLAFSLIGGTQIGFTDDVGARG